MGATGASIKAALQSCGAYGGQKWSMDELAKGANDAARTLGITTKEGLAVLIAQCMIESAWFRSTVEYTSQYTARYDPYRGRTFIMNTFVAGYRLVGRYAKKKGLLSDSEYFVKNPTRLGDYKWAWHGPAAYFEANGLVARANRGENKAVGRIIHAGPGRVNYPTNQLERNRENHATKAYNAVLRSGITAPGKSSGSSGSSFWTPPSTVKMTVKQIQKAAGVTADGAYGSGTKAAVKKLQKKLGVTADGLFGPATESAYKKSQKSPASKPAAKKPAAKPAASKPKPATSKAPKFPLPAGHWYGVESSNPKNHSGYHAKDRAGIKQWQSQMRKRGWKITADGRFGKQSASVARAFQKEKRLTVDGKIGASTWAAAWTAKVT